MVVQNGAGQVEKSKNLKPATPNDDDDIEELLEDQGIIKLDGGYGWIVVIASFFANLIVDGVIFSISDSIVPLWVETFHTNTAMATISTSLLVGCYLLSGPVASAAANIFGCDKVSIAGAAIAATGILLSALPVPNLPLLYLTFGIIGGIGYGLIYLPAIVIVGQYFTERRALATGIAVCGSGVGTALLGYANPLILNISEQITSKEEKWRLFLVFIASITLLCAVFGLFFKPPSPTEAQIEKVAAIASEVILPKQRTESLVVATERGSSEDKKKSIDSVNEHILSPHIPQGVAIERFEPNPKIKRRRRRRLDSSRPFISMLELVASELKESDLAKSHKDVAESVTKASILTLNRPLSRIDIFYTGSQLRLNSVTERRQQPNERSRGRSHKQSDTVDRKSKSNLHLSTAVIPTEINQSKGFVASWKNGIRDSLSLMLELSLLKSPSFLILAFTGFLCLACLFVPFMFVGKLAQQNGVPEQMTPYLVVILGLVNLFGRVLAGLIADHPRIDPVMISNICVIVGGIATIIAPLLTSFWMFVVYCAFFAFGVAGFSTLRSVICVELLGLEKLTSAYGLLMLFMGIAALSGPPFAAFLMNLTNNYRLSFMVMGSIMLLSGILSLPLRRVNEWENKYDKNTKFDDEKQKLNTSTSN